MQKLRFRYPMWLRVLAVTGSGLVLLGCSSLFIATTNGSNNLGMAASITGMLGAVILLIVWSMESKYRLP